MTATMDHRIADRRQVVREAGARRRLRRALVLLVVAAVVGVGFWLVYQSSYLAVGHITLDGEVRSRAREIVAAAGLAEDMPTINVRPEAIEDALLADPWIAAAAVEVTWPGTVDVVVLEHEAAAWVEAGSAWLLVARDGTVLERSVERSSRLPSVSVESVPVTPGGRIDAAAIGAVEFLEFLPAGLAADILVTGSADRLESEVAGHPVLLGYPIDMGEKALALAALLDSGLDPDVEISLLSPERPAVKLQQEIETSEEVLGVDCLQANLEVEPQGECHVARIAFGAQLPSGHQGRRGRRRRRKRRQ